MTEDDHIPDPPIPPRFIRILDLLSRGLQSKQIAVELRLSVGTTRIYMSDTYRLLRRLGFDVTNAHGAIGLAFRQGWIK